MKRKEVQKIGKLSDELGEIMAGNNFPTGGNLKVTLFICELLESSKHHKCGKIVAEPKWKN